MTGPVEAARHEVEQRAAEYPRRVLSGLMPAEGATVDYQAWCCILGWLETDRFASIAGGGADGRTVVGWPEAVIAADRALADTLALAGARATAAMAQADPARAAKLRDRAAALDARASALQAIARMVRLRADTIARLNHDFRARRMAASA